MASYSSLTVVSGTTITSAWGNNVRNSAVCTQTSGTRPGSPTDGQTIFETDTGALLGYSSADAAWREFARLGTPATIIVYPQQTVSITTSAKTSHVSYDGRWVSGEVSMVLSSAGTSGGAFYVTVDVTSALPVPAATTGLVACGQFLYNDSGTAIYEGTVRVENISGNPRFAFWVHNTNASLGGTPTFAAASGDTMNFTFRYRW